MFNFSELTVICGHYGVGKTNLSINLAVYLSKMGKEVILIDLDVINPYFRCSDYTDYLKYNHVNVISQAYAKSNLDIPYISSEISSSFASKNKYIIIDAGGDDSGSLALGRFYNRVVNIGSYKMFYVINFYRPMIENVESNKEYIKQIEASSRLKSSGIINNSNLANLTTIEDIVKAKDYANETAELLNIPCVMNTFPRFIDSEKLCGKVNNLFPVDIYVNSPW